MSTSPRYLPPGKFLAEITQCCLGGLFLLRPSERLNLLITGVVAKACLIYPIEIVGLTVLSNHLHLIATGPSQGHLSDFMNFVSGNVAREAARLHGWRGRFWSRRYKCIPITDEEKIQVERLSYLFSQGCKEDLVASPCHWPGIHCAKALMTGQPMPGVWVDRTALYDARRRKKGRDKIRPIDFEENLLLEFAPLPCWAHLEPEEYQRRMRGLAEEVEAKTAERHRQLGKRPLGRKAVLRQRPLHRVETPKKPPAPRVHAATSAARKKFLEALRIFLRAYRAASARLRSGELTAVFPEGSIPPHGPFVEPRGAPIPP